MRTIAMVELESDFPSTFSREILKCLPENVAKLIIQPHTHQFENNSISLGKHSMVIYVADKVEEVSKSLSKTSKILTLLIFL
jgi:putative heme iron utilization protein